MSWWIKSPLSTINLKGSIVDGTIVRNMVGNFEGKSSHF